MVPLTVVGVQALGRQKLSRFLLVPHPVDDVGTDQGMSDVAAEEVDVRDEDHRGYTQQHCGQK